MPDPRFSADEYRRFNMDLAGLTDQDLADHFANHRGEPRLYGPVEGVREAMSMRWLRGEGLEVGAGRDPLPLFGNAHATHVGIDDRGVFGSTASVAPSIDDATFPASLGRQFSFVAASHVLEHCDSFLRALENACTVTEPGGVVYLILPDVRFLPDREWIAAFPFDHHVTEYGDALAHAEEHDRRFIEGYGSRLHLHPDIPAEYADGVAKGLIPPHLRFVHHKHNYDLAGWCSLIEDARRFLGATFRLADARYDHERADCHFVLTIAA